MSVQNENTAGGESVVLERPAAGGVYASLFEKINLNPVSELSALDIWQDAQAMSDATADERLTAGMQVFLECLTKSGSKVEKLDKNLIDHHIADATTYGDAYHYADNYLTAGSAYDHNPVPESGAFYARIRHERYLNGQTQTRATTSCPTLAPGQVLKVTGGYEVAEVFTQGVVITAMHSHARRDEDFGVSFDGIPDSTDFCFRPEPGSRPVMAGTLPARVTSTTENDTYGHIDKDGRYRVNMLFDRDNWETGFESLWVRQSRPYAGDTYGLHLPLLAGTEVAIGFEGGNRLTQETLEPVALLHRPDQAPSGGLEDGMRMAAYNVPIKENIIKHLWLAGLTKEQRAEVVESQNKHPVQSVEDEAIVNLDVSMGHAGAAAPWLAIAAAIEIAQQTQLPQMIISGDTTQDVLWSTLITPIASRQEMDA